ncbi:MAG: AAA family ATPase [Candidatus Omnitrophica bacterium]|nr:AAA family ATPase [Candidatus Omnitrophota bacterium]MDD5351605.1 AAA family ATPase [Candidatus Omnitrophota bacterium]MDD5550814.1 AAA family ATPase [Candidatus Omnitrophota bacterium]
MAKVIAICNQKGGTGKTTTAINLSVYLSLQGNRILLIDLDPQGNSTSGLGIDKDNLQGTIYDVLINSVDANSLLLKTYDEKLQIIPADIHLIGAELELANIDNRERRLLTVIETVRQNYDYLIIDAPPSLGLLTLNALVAANSVIIPVQCEYFALEGLGQLLRTINLVKEKFNPKLEIEGVLLTMADFRTNLTAEVINETRAFFKEKVFRTIIPRSIRLSEAPGFGKPIYLYDRSSIGALKYDELAKEILDNIGKQPSGLAGVS